MTEKQAFCDVLDYLLHLDKLRAKRLCRLVDHKLPLFLEADLTGLPGVERDLIHDGSEIWLSVRRLHAAPPPQPHEWLTPWIHVPSDPTKEPTIADSVELPAEQVPQELAQQASRTATARRRRSGGSASQHDLFSDALPTEPGTAAGQEPATGRITLRLDDIPQIRGLYEQYLANAWRPWAEKERPRRETIRLYDRLFSLFQDTQTRAGADDGIEVAWGIGIALWAHPESEETISYPLISRTVELVVDEQTLAIHVQPTEREPLVHTEVFDGLDLVGHASQIEARAQREFAQSDRTVSPFDAATFEGILRFAAGHLDPQGRYWPDGKSDDTDRCLPLSTAHLTVTDTWAIFARQRSTGFIAADVRRLKEAVAAAEWLPAAAAMIVTEPPDAHPPNERCRFRGISTAGLFGEFSGDGRTEEDLLFPKPFNAEQVKIIEQLEQSDGVVVQGPPGTGKTHTIANVICHYLALGKRVLVTSQHEAPLAVLQGQIPESLRPLTIALLTSERDGIKQLEHTIRKLAEERQRRDRDQLDREIQDETKRIDQLHQQLAAIDKDLQKWAERQLADTSLLGGGRRADQLARYVVESEQDHAWFPDRLAGDDATLPGFSETEIDALRAARREVGADLCYLGQTLPSLAQLPSAEEMASLHVDLLRLTELHDQLIAPRHVPPLRDEGHETVAGLESLRADVHKALVRLKEGTRVNWVINARPLFSGPATPVADALKNWVKEALRLERQRQNFMADALEIPAEAELHSGLFEAVQRAAKGAKPFPLFKGDKKAKTLLGEIRMAGMPPSEAGHWQRVLEYLETARAAERLLAQWNLLRGEFDGPEVAGRGMSVIKGLREQARCAAWLWQLDTSLAPRIRGGIEGFFANRAAFPDFSNSPDRLGSLLAAVETHLEHCRLKVARPTRSQLKTQFERCDGPVFTAARRFLNEYLGVKNVSTDQIFDDWQAVIEELRRIERLAEPLTTISAMTARIEAAGAKRWAAALRRESLTEGSDPWLPGTWRDAWEWARICGYLDAIDGREALRGLAQTRIDAEAKLRAAYLRLVEHRTWRKLLEAITPRVGAALNAYLAAVAHMGRGLGVRAIGLRRDARKAMTAAYKATPCWIMPHWRVSESLPPELGIFDLVIIDEASQSDAWALPAIARGQKLLIVGDDKQVSPSDVGWKESEIDRLRHRFLQRLPYPQHFLPGRSIYDLGSTMFAGSLIRLREHFRCVEPIIAFSNREFYANEIKPLRIPSPQERLDPPLIDVYVKGGYRRGTIKINEPEAQAIIDEIERLTQDQRTQGRSIGVVSLLGSEQARYIQDRLFQRLGEETYLRHRIRCGDAMHFQGKECDIVLVSMVSTGEDRAVSGRVFKQRYNVACSRARDRLYLFHSFERTHLNDRDLRARLLDHFAQPLGLELDTDRDPRDLCESDFERSVYDALVQLGYRVTTQVRAGGYRIDLVVDGLDGRRLAIECDGDQYHVGRWMEDMARQRVLERMGWRFWRCWASSWITARDTCLQDLIETLAARGIEPWSGEQSARQSALVEYRIIEPADDGPTASGEIPEAEPGTVAEGIQSTDIPHEADGNDDRDDDSTEQPLSPDDLDPASSTAPRRVDQVTMPQIRDAIVASLSNSPHYSGTRSSMTTRVLKELGIRTRGKPRTAFERRVQRGVADLAKQGVLQEYKSKNLRIRLTRGNAAP